ncbi:uncharacterized protein LOC129291268 isoform X1 [Prosopis cineraria]|uniref:uncharacterized protein LOC129291268 isoform X1 n=1 Tax=Prosopis cineraria TaxID=364024 RepID=UPI00240EE902|nr:uncharacterized protein LOC129291268 isoform X1 [Prosopis cineraria]XP_054784518.1 uncharacterized protein LOC129291268 isoform X1 [Prosopis cineraria]
MALHLELKKMRSKGQQSSAKIVKERLDLPQFENGLSPPLGNRSHEVRQNADGKTFVQSTRNSRRQSSKRRATKSDELVKHMTNLPHYLLHADREENIQDNPLNFGVLDWTQLEKWKHKQRYGPVKASNFASFQDGESSSRKTTKSSAAATVGTSHKHGLYEGAKPCFQNVRRPRHFETEEKRKDLDKSVSAVRTFASFLRQDGVPLVSNENKYGGDSEAEKSMESLQESNLEKKEKNRELRSDMGLRSSKVKSKGISVGSKKKGGSRSSKIKIRNEELEESDIDVMESHDDKQDRIRPNNIVLLRPREISSSSNKTNIKDNQLQESDTDANRKQGPGKPKNIVLLRPRPIPQSSSDILELSRRRTSFDEYFAESSRSSLSSVSLFKDIDSEDACSKIPHSSEMCSMVQPVPTLGSLLLRTDTDQGTDCSSVASETPSFASKTSTLHSEGAYLERDALSNKLTNQCDFSDLKESLDQETAELAAKRSRNLSSSRRFSFSLSRIGRSFSFKEGSALPQLSSTYVSAKSGPVTSSSSARWYSSSKEKENGHDRSRSSPLRRLLDPILKRKASKLRHSAESSQVQKESLDSISFRTTSVSESLLDQMSESSSIQAHLQVTIKNGLPFFKFVPNNEVEILAAAMKSLESSVKDDLNYYFTFYLLHEVKKKSGGWISHGSKEKGHDYVYNVVGQMKFSTSTITKPSNQDSKTLSVQKEYVLSSVEIDQTDQGPPKVIRRGELAAAVVEIPLESLIHKGPRWDNNSVKGCLKCSAEERCRCNLGENDISGSTTVILPGGIHGSSDRGEPSPLIHRWRSGGLCDCGGWDIGCKLLVLSNPRLSSESQREYFQLFVQEGAEPDSPAFSLVPLKEGLYSVVFNSSITHLQAFFISIAVLSCQKPSSLEMTVMQEQIFKELSSLKSGNNLPGNAPVNYTPIPPPSPAGRV